MGNFFGHQYLLGLTTIGLVYRLIRSLQKLASLAYMLKKCISNFGVLSFIILIIFLTACTSTPYYSNNLGLQSDVIYNDWMTARIYDTNSCSPYIDVAVDAFDPSFFEDSQAIQYIVDETLNRKRYRCVLVQDIRIFGYYKGQNVYRSDISYQMEWMVPKYQYNHPDHNLPDYGQPDEYRQPSLSQRDDPGYATSFPLAETRPSTPSASSENTASPETNAGIDSFFRRLLSEEQRVLGITIETRTIFGDKQGAEVMFIDSASRASEAGLRTGDVITSINRNVVTSSEDLIKFVSNIPAFEESAQIGFMRGAQKLTVNIPLISSLSLQDINRNRPAFGQRESLELPVSPLPTPESRPSFSSVSPEIFPPLETDAGTDSFSGESQQKERRVLGITIETRAVFGDKQGAEVMFIDSASSASEAGLRTGDVITSINGNAVTSSQDLIDSISDIPPFKQSAQISFKRGVHEQTSDVPLISSLSLQDINRNRPTYVSCSIKVGGTSDAKVLQIPIQYLIDLESKGLKETNKIISYENFSDYDDVFHSLNASDSCPKGSHTAWIPILFLKYSRNEIYSQINRAINDYKNSNAAYADYFLHFDENQKINYLFDPKGDGNDTSYNFDSLAENLRLYESSVLPRVQTKARGIKI